MALNEHGYSEAARLELINLIHGPITWLTLGSDERATALLLLGQISLDDDELSGALHAWGLLVEDYPDSQVAELVQKKIAEVEADFDRQLADLKSSAEATRYFSIADGWLEAAEYEAPSIDTSYIPDDVAALDWLNLTIERFPGTSHAELAYERLIEYQLWAAGQDARIAVWGHSAFKELGVSDTTPITSALESANTSVLQSETILGDFERAFPDSDKLQRLRYLVGQSYWFGGEVDKARHWFSKVIEEDRDGNTFYRDLAFRRLQHLPDLYENTKIDG